MVYNQYATGKKVYGQGSYAPTRGRVAPQGYIQRELARRAKLRSVSQTGYDGLSDTRSGLASAALKRTASFAAPQGIAQTPAPNPNLPTQQSTQPTPSTSGPLTTPPVSSGAQQKYNDQGTQGPQTTGAGNPNPAAGANPLGPVTPTVQINPNGTLDLPYDIQATSDLLAQKEAANQALLDLQASEQDQALDFTTNRRNMDIDYEGLRREALNRASGRGTAFSSGYGLAVGDNARDYNNMLNDLLAGNNNFKQQAEKQRNGIVTNFNDFIRKEALDRAARMAEQAGSLGYGSGTTAGTADPGTVKPKPKPTTKPKPKPKPKPKHTTKSKPKPKPKAKKPANTPRTTSAKLKAAAARRRAAANRAAAAKRKRK